MSDDIDKANYADLKTSEDRVRRTLFAHGFNEKTSTPLGDMNSLCRNLVQDAAATDAELAALQARLADAEAQRAVLVAALEHIRGAKWDDIEGQPMIVLGRTPSGLGTSLIAPAEVCRQALANQPPNDLVALVKAVEKLKPHCDSAKRHGEWLDASGEIAWWGLLAALEALLTNQPGFRALIDGEDV